MAKGRTRNTEADFWAKVAITEDPDECWMWHNSAGNGYGLFNWNGKKSGAHRVAYMLTNKCGIEPGLVIRHTCDTPGCCNPAHLVPGTRTQNIEDRDRRGRTARTTGDRNGSRTCPESRPRGDNHWTRRNPEKLLRGQDHWMNKHPDLMTRNGSRWSGIKDQKE